MTPDADAASRLTSAGRNVLTGDPTDEAVLDFSGIGGDEDVHGLDPFVTCVSRIGGNHRHSTFCTFRHDTKEVRRVTTRVTIALKAACDRADINIPYPIRTLYFFDQDRYDDHYPVTANSNTN